MATNRFQKTNLIVGVWGRQRQLVQTLLILFSICLSSTVFANTSSNVTVTMINAISGNPVSGVKIIARERLTDGSTPWRAESITNAQGQGVFNLEGLGQGRSYHFTAQPYEKWVSSPDQTAPGALTFKVGQLQVKLINGSTGQPWGEQPVHLMQMLADGSLKHVMSATTNANGLLRLDPPNITKTKKYVMGAHSPIDGTWKTSTVVTQGYNQITLFNKRLTVTLVDAISKTPLTGIKVHANERKNDGTYEWRNSGITNAQGKVAFDLDNLGKGSVYSLNTQAYGKWVYSSDINSTGNFSFEIGQLQVKLINGATNKPWPNQPVALMRSAADGNFETILWTETDSNGLLRLNPPNSTNASTFAIKAKSPANDSTWKTSKSFGLGNHRIVLGNTPLNVALIDNYNKRPLAGINIHARERLANGGYARVDTRTTDANGLAVFDLDGLGQGRKYFVSANPYAGTVSSRDISSPGDFTLQAGTVPVKLTNADNGQAIVGHEVVALLKHPDGTTAWASKGTTNDWGIARFDFEGLGHGERYVFYVQNPLGDGKYHFSETINSNGPVKFDVSFYEPNKLDRSLPNLSINTPDNGSLVPPSGFQVSGYASDDVGITDVTAFVFDPVIGLSKVPIQYEINNERWVANIPSSAITVGKTATLTVKAFDAAYNITKINQSYQVVQDNDPPQITIDSHANGDWVSERGFLLAGSVTDNTVGIALTATVHDSQQGKIVDQYPLEVSASGGRWALAVHHKDLSPNSRISVTLTATDREGNASSAPLSLEVNGAVDLGRQLINRITFGTTPQTLQDIKTLGNEAFLEQQLAPQTIDDSAFDAMMTSFQPLTRKELKLFQLQHAIHSRRQLREVMTWFWDNHFNTDSRKRGDLSPVSRELAENRAFRANAFGRFRDLLEISAKSPAMLIYLDGTRNAKWSPNENYARELMELHTLGVNGGYTQKTVEEVARAFTGWRVVDNAFFFDSQRHDTDAKTVLGQPIAANGGVEDGEQVLDILASHPATARHLCKKLAVLFISDSPPATSINQCTDTYLSNIDSPNQIAEIVRTLLTSQAFKNPNNFRAKVKTPLEFLVGAVRTLDAEGDFIELPFHLESMGMNLFEYPVPTGYAEHSEAWLSSQSILTRLNFVNQLARNATSKKKLINVDLVSLFQNSGVETAEGIVGFIFNLAFDGRFSGVEWTTALGVLTDNGTIEFDIDAPDAEQRLQRLVGMILSFPGFQLQ